MKVYIDNDVVSGFRRRDLKSDELIAVDALKSLADSGRISLVVSAVHDVEAAPLPQHYREAQTELLALFPRVDFADDHRVYGAHTIDVGPAGRYGSIAYPLVEDDPVARRLREIGLDRRDAHHVMLAIRRQCDAFATCDEQTILNHREEIERDFPIRLMLPSEVARIGGPP